MAIYFAKQCLKDLGKESKEIQEKVLTLIDALSKGAKLSMPVAKDMAGHPGLKELRVRDAKGIVRVFYYIAKGDSIYILHLFRKKSQKTPKHEITTALNRLKILKGTK